jgi:hypothetical protein
MSNLIIDLDIIGKHGKGGAQGKYLAKQYNEAELRYDLLV